MSGKTITCLILSVVLIVLAVQYRRGKWLASIAGYNMLSKSERRTIDIRPYATLISSVCVWTGLLLFVIAIEDWVKIFFPVAVSIIISILAILMGIAFFRLLRFLFINNR